MPLIVRQQEPFNAETPPPALVGSWITPLADFYLRSHAPAPAIDARSYAIAVEGLVDRPLRLSVDELRSAFPQVEVAALLECAGNRRDGHNRVERIEDDVPWDCGAVGNAAWRGVRLADILARAGVRGGARHVAFAGLDVCATPEGAVPFGASIPIEKALRPETLVALDMNGEPLSTEHGFPARTIVPGFIGARSVKWLASIVVSERPSDNHYQARSYKVFPPDVRARTVDWTSVAAIDEYPINSAICSPAPGETVPPGALVVRGYAHAAGLPDRRVARVEVSADGGTTWIAAEVTAPDRPFAWALWRAQVSVPRGPATLVCRVVDSSGGAQPERVDWNFKGYLYNAWHRVPVIAA